MTTLQQAAQKALELLDKQWKCDQLWSMQECQEIAESLKAALAQQGEPVLWASKESMHMWGKSDESGHPFHIITKGQKVRSHQIPLYTAAPAPQAQECGYDQTTGNCTSNPCCRSAPQAQSVAAQACNPLCELCVKRGYNFCANVAQTTPLPMLQSTQPAKTKQLLGKFDHLTDEEILTIAHRKATRYTHAVAPGQITYGFTVAHAVDFARAIKKASEST